MLSKPSNSSSNSKSRAFKAVFKRLPASCNAGGVRLTLFCHKFPPIGDEADIDGDKGGVDPIPNGLIDPISIELIEPHLGEGMAEPVEAYKGRNSSTL